MRSLKILKGRAQKISMKIIVSFTVIGIILLISIVAWSSEEESSPLIFKEEKLWENGQIGVVLNKVERTDVLPSGIIERSTNIQFGGISDAQFGQIPELTEGYDFVIVYLNIADIKNVHVVSLGGRGEEKSILYDIEDNKCNLLCWNVQGIKFSDPHDITKPIEFTEDAKCILVFKIPKHEKPKVLTFVYYFKETWEGSRMKGEIDIKV